MHQAELLLEETEKANKVRTPLLPTYSMVRSLLSILEGVPKQSFAQLVKAVHEQTGTPQSPVDWSNPDEWIRERLNGECERLATRIWNESAGVVNPRYVSGCQWFFNGYGLVEVDSSGRFQLTSRGKAFISNDHALLRDLDEAEGLLQLLLMLRRAGKVVRGDLLEEWGTYLKEHSTFGTLTTIKDTLRRRLVNLYDRKLIEREGNTYWISDEGLKYIASVETPSEAPRRTLEQQIHQYNQTQREALRERLSKMHPYHFEQLVRDLLDAMGYDDGKRSGHPLERAGGWCVVDRVAA